MKRFILAMLFTMFVPILALAQEPGGSDTGADTDLVAVVVADISVFDVEVEETNGALVGSFALRGNAGQQNDIVYGVLAIDESNTIVDTAVLGEGVQVQEGDTIIKPFSYDLPGHLKGNVALYLRVETAAGLPLGTQLLLTRSFTGSGSSIQCSKDENSSNFSCQNSVAEDVLVTYHEGSPLGVLVGDKTVKVTAGKNFSPMIDEEPGQYVVVLRGATSNSYAQFPVRVSGVFGRIRNVMMYEKEEGGRITGTVTATVSGVTGANVKVALAGPAGSCGEAGASLLGEVATFTIPASCKSGTVTVSLSDELGNELDRSEQPFSIEKVTQDVKGGTGEVGQTPTVEPSGSGMSTGVIILVTLGSLGLLLSLLYVLRRKHMPTLIFVIAFFGSVTGMAHTVSAMTISQTAFSGPMLVLDDNDWRCTYDVNTDKATYAPGDSMTISGSATCAGGMNITQSNSGLNYNAPSGSPTNPLFDTPSPLVAGAPSLVSHNDPSGGATVYSFSAPFSRVVTVPGTILPGSHYLALRVSAAVQANGDPVGMSTAYRNLTFNVAAANSAPTAGAGSDQTITFPTNSVTISGASATDSDGSIAGISWTGPGGITISGGNTLTPTFSGFPSAGTYTFTLTVTDNGGATNSDTMQVIVFAAAPSCGWEGTAYLGAQAGLHNTTKCSSPLPTMGSEPQAGYCDSAGENGTTAVCCDSAADCYRFTCNYGGSCGASVQLNFQ